MDAIDVLKGIIVAKDEQIERYCKATGGLSLALVAKALAVVRPDGAVLIDANDQFVFTDAELDALDEATFEVVS